MSSQRLIIVRRCRELRKRITPAESAVWEIVRNRKFNNLKFLRQPPIIHNLINGQLYYFIADFYCAKLKLVIEIDGASHNESKDYDLMRDTILTEYGLTTLRIKNDDAVNEKTLIQILSEAIKQKG
ncbi:MAG: endonuclease domain-containing protein [Ignavibacteriales bacterium]|nr:MAG: endonuclease domain-containing protein [Ignavibacteriales bacterium]